MRQRLLALALALLCALALASHGRTAAAVAGAGPTLLGASGSAAAPVVPMPPGASLYLNAATGFVPSGGGEGSWTSTIGPHTWAANGNCTATTTVNGKAAVSFPSVGGTCVFTSDVTADNYFSSTCWTIAAAYQYTGTACGVACPSLAWNEGADLLSGTDRYEQFIVADLGATGPNAAAIAAETRLAGAPFVALSQVNSGASGSTGSPHYGIVSACGGSLVAYLDGAESIPAAIGAMNLSTSALNIPAPGGLGAPSYFYGGLVAVALWPSQPDLVATNSWAKYVGGF